MVARKLAGPGAGVRKYDLLTALAVAGLAGSPSFSTSMTRLIALVTARYNWARDEVKIGQADLAKMWSCDLRTVKRELKRLKELGVLRVKRAGVRGRVSSYQLDHARIDALTAPAWPLVGPDYQDRMGAAPSASGGGDENIVPFPTHRTSAKADSNSEWGRASLQLARDDPARHAAWFAPLQRHGLEHGTLILRAPTAFHAGYVTTHLLGEIVRAVSTAKNAPVSVEIISE